VFSGLPAAFHFNRVSLAGIVANLLALPVVSLVVMPAAVAAMLAMPFGIEAAPLAVMGFGVSVVVAIAEAIAALPGAAIAVASPPAAAMALAAAGLIALCIGGARARIAGAALLGLAVVLTLAPRDRPVLLVEAEGRTAALRNGGGDLVPAPGRRGRFAVTQWLAAEGDATPPAEAARRAGWTCGEGVCAGDLDGKRVLYIGRGAIPPLTCGEAAIVVAADPLYGRCRAAALVIDRFDLWRLGAHAVHQAGDGSFSVETAAGQRGARPWAVKPVARASIVVGGRTP
jgi:competence protein ComEC